MNYYSDSNTGLDTKQINIRGYPCKLRGRESEPYRLFDQENIIHIKIF